MTDVDLIAALYVLRDRAIAVHEYPMAMILRDAAHRLKDLPTPPPPGSIAVRIAVAVGQSGKMACYLFEDTDSMDEARDDVNRFGSDTVTNEAIIVAHIPLRTIPEVIATVETFDPEATV